MWYNRCSTGWLVLIETKKETEMAQETFVTTHHSNVIGVMSQHHYIRLYREGLFFSKDGIDWKRAIAAGVRLFVFKDIEVVETPYTGTMYDFISMAAACKFDYYRLEYGAFCVPFAGQRRFDGDEIYEVTADDFHLAFGRDAWTSVFPRSR